MNNNIHKWDNNIQKWKDNVHKWIVPVLYTAIWTLGLYTSQFLSDIYPFGPIQIKVFSFAFIFVIFFVEFIIMLFDTYLTTGAYTISPRFILVMCVVMSLFVFFFHFIINFFAVSLGNQDEVIVKSITKILVLSSLMKLLEMLIQNNPKWFMEMVQTTQINREERKFINRSIEL